MSSLGVITLVGKSGTPYRFKAYPLGTVFKQGFAAVYVLTQRTLKPTTGATRHKPLRLGRSADLHQGGTDAPNALATGANCICVHAEPDEKQRLGIEQDLMAHAGQRRD